MAGGILCIPYPARADATVFAGALTSGGVHQVVGASAGRFIAPNVGFELELMRTTGAAGHRTETFAGNFIVQSTPRPRRPQFYAALGVGVYGETYRDGRGSGEVAVGSFGAGVKVKIGGPFRVRLEYRALRLGETADASPDMVIHHHPQRVSAGIGIAF